MSATPTSCAAFEGDDTCGAPATHRVVAREGDEYGSCEAHEDAWAENPGFTVRAIPPTTCAYIVNQDQLAPAVRCGAPATHLVSSPEWRETYGSCDEHAAAWAEQHAHCSCASPEVVPIDAPGAGAPRIIVSRHPAAIEYIRGAHLRFASAPVIASATADDVRGKFAAAFRASLPPGSIITSIGSRDHERATRVVAVRVVPDAECAPFEAEPGWHAWNRMDGGTTYRTRSRRLDAETPGGTRISETDDTLSWEAPLPLTLAEALAASAMTLTSGETRCSVREEHGRWVYETGTGSMLRSHGSADTREEAEVMATAILYRAWLAGVERIMRARGGSLRWGQPIVAPTPVTQRRFVVVVMDDAGWEQGGPDYRAVFFGDEDGYDPDLRGLVFASREEAEATMARLDASGDWEVTNPAREDFGQERPPTYGIVIA